MCEYQYTSVMSITSSPHEYIVLNSRTPGRERFSIDKISSNLSLSKRLLLREEVDPSELDHALETRAKMHRAGAPYFPVYPTNRLFPGTYYLDVIDPNWKRTYLRVPLDAPLIETGLPLAPESVLKQAKIEEISTPVTGRLRVLSKSDADVKEMLDEAQNRISCVITGVSAGLPGKSGPVFSKDNLEKLVEGEQRIQPLSDELKLAMLEKNVVQLKKHKDGTVERFSVDQESALIQIAAQLGHLSLVDAYGVPPGLAQTMDLAAQIAVAAGLEALKDAGLVTGRSSDPREWEVFEEYRDTTGVVYASSFPAMDAAVGEVMRFLNSKTVDSATSRNLVVTLRNRFMKVAINGVLSKEDERAFSRLLAATRTVEDNKNEYVFDRKFLFRVLVLGNAQLAQLAKCRGPNTQTNAACAGTTQAIAMAQDMLISGRADRVVVVAGDNASGDTLLPWLGSGFRALGAATTKAAVEDAALPFDKRRSGMILGAGGIGMVLETEASAAIRVNSSVNCTVKARLVATQYSNSAFHGAALDRKHISSELKRFLTEIEFVHGISKSDVATHGVYFSHETSTHASDAASCAGNEVAALREAFGDELLSKMLILNTKGFTGHPMGVSFEDITAVQVLLSQKVPPVVNYKQKDEYLGDLKLSKGGPYTCRYALRFAAGFGSQVAFALYATA